MNGPLIAYAASLERLKFYHPRGKNSFEVFVLVNELILIFLTFPKYFSMNRIVKNTLHMILFNILAFF